MRAVLGMVIALVLAGPAAAADSVVMLSDAGDYIGGGEARIYHPGNGQVSVGGSTSYVTIGVSGGSRGDSFHLEFAAPAGQILAPGVYDDAQRAAFREAGRPGIDIGGDGRGCNTIEGRFEVRAFDVSPDGTLQRLWIVYEQHCEGGTAALFGEVRLGTDHALSPAILRWPISDLGRGGAAVPVTFVAPAATTVSGVGLAGAHPGDFTIRLDECSGRTLVAGGSCQVWVRFTPAAPGTREALLHVHEGGRTHESALQGFTYGGSTKLEMHSDDGDYIGAGGDYLYTPQNDRIAVGGSRRYVGFGVDSATGDWWYGDFSAPEGDILAAGSTYESTRYPFNGSGAGLSISGNGRGCNQLTGRFTVTELTFHDDGELRSAGIDFEQHCEGATPALRGTIEFRKGDTTPPPPWTVSGPGTVGPSTRLVTPGQAAPAPPPPTAAPPAGRGTEASRTGPCTTRAWARRPLLLGTSAADRLRGKARAEVLIGGAGSDRLWGRGGDDCLDGGSGADTLSGGAGRDRMFGGSSNDRLDGGPGRDRIDCGTGRKDAVFVGRGDRVKGCERRIRPRR